jgi:hypothetical protein
MSLLDGFMKALPLGNMASQMGIGNDVMSNAIGHLAPTMFGGLAANAARTGGADGILNSLANPALGGLFNGTSFNQQALGSLAPAVGQGLLGNMFGGAPQQAGIMNHLSGMSGVPAGVLGQVAPALAPMAMGFLGHQVTGAGGGASALTNVLGGLTGGSGGMLSGLTSMLGHGIF